MDAKICVHCNCPHDYYSNEYHASRKSCRISKNGHHEFEYKFIYGFKMFLNKLYFCFRKL